MSNEHSHSFLIFYVIVISDCYLMKHVIVTFFRKIEVKVPFDISHLAQVGLCFSKAVCHCRLCKKKSMLLSRLH